MNCSRSLTGAWFPFEEVAAMVSYQQQDAFLLLAFLRATQGPTTTFMCANGLADKFGWHRKRLANARRQLIELAYIKQVRFAHRGEPALYQWA
jgi:hypothetical protein